MKFNLIENAKDSLRHAVVHMTEDKPTVSDLKKIILDISHTIELLLKERLRQVHPAFIYKDIDKQQNTTVGVELSVTRLRHLAGIVLSDEMIKTINLCIQLRNSIIHYEFEINEKDTKIIIGRLLSFIFQFSKKYLSLDLEAEFKTDDTWRVLIDSYEFWAEHKKIVEDELADKSIEVFECFYCKADTFQVELGICALCDHSGSPEICDYCQKPIWSGDSLELEEGSMSSRVVCIPCYDESMADLAGQMELDRIRGK